ncbi:MAG: nucleotidyltransferase family protein [Bacteroidota bacterium]
MLSEIRNIAEKIIPVLKKHEVKKAGLFGSIVRGEATEQSDVDLLVEAPKDISLLGFVHIMHELEDVLGRKVDLVEYSAVKPALRERILAEEFSIL